MKRIDYKNKEVSELEHLLIDQKSKLVKLSFDWTDKKLKDSSQIKKTKIEVARILTALRQLKS